MNDMLVRRVAIVTDWFSDPEFFSDRDTVCLLCESRSLIQSARGSTTTSPVGRSPSTRYAVAGSLSVLHLRQPASSMIPVTEPRQPPRQPRTMQPVERNGWPKAPAGLSIHSLRQLLLAASYNQRPVSRTDVVQQVEQFIQAQLGDDVIEFKKPVHTLKDVIGFSKLKQFLTEYMIPSLATTR